MNTSAFFEIIEVNPKVKLEKNTEYPFVDMGSVEPTRRYVSCGDYRVF
jgi:hypothetical protein